MKLNKEVIIKECDIKKTSYLEERIKKEEEKANVYIDIQKTINNINEIKKLKITNKENYLSCYLNEFLECSHIKRTKHYNCYDYDENINCIYSKNQNEESLKTYERTKKEKIKTLFDRWNSLIKYLIRTNYIKTKLDTSIMNSECIYFNIKNDNKNTYDKQSQEKNEFDKFKNRKNEYAKKVKLFLKEVYLKTRTLELFSEQFSPLIDQRIENIQYQAKGQFNINISHIEKLYIIKEKLDIHDLKNNEIIELIKKNGKDNEKIEFTRNNSVVGTLFIDGYKIKISLNNTELHEMLVFINKEDAKLKNESNKKELKKDLIKLLKITF